MLSRSERTELLYATQASHGTWPPPWTKNNRSKREMDLTGRQRAHARHFWNS